LKLLELSRSLDEGTVEHLVSDRDYEQLDLLIIRHLLGDRQQHRSRS